MPRREPQSKAGNLGALNADFNFDVSEQDETQISIAGTFVGTVSFFISDDGINFVPIAGVAANSTARTTGVISTTAGGNSWSFRTHPYKVLRARMTAYTSGTANVRGSGFTR